MDEEQLIVLIHGFIREIDRLIQNKHVSKDFQALIMRYYYIYRPNKLDGSWRCESCMDWSQFETILADATKYLKCANCATSSCIDQSEALKVLLKLIDTYFGNAGVRILV